MTKQLNRGLPGGQGLLYCVDRPTLCYLTLVFYKIPVDRANNNANEQQTGKSIKSLLDYGPINVWNNGYKKKQKKKNLLHPWFITSSICFTRVLSIGILN